ncbi:MAG: histidine kinase dimerization/phospho-acceptor domain-containing protein, partial [Candidatus Binatia bacterium]
MVTVFRGTAGNGSKVPDHETVGPRGSQIDIDEVQRGSSEMESLLNIAGRSSGPGALVDKCKNALECFAASSEEVADRKRTEDILAERTVALATLGELASEIAHELNNPLAAVMTFAHLLKSQDLPGGVGEDVDKIFTEAQRAAKVVHNLLAFARRHEPEKEYTDV